MKKAVRKRIEELFTLENLLPLSQARKGGEWAKVSRALYLLALTLCFVSFLATAEGLSTNMFGKSHSLRAYLISLAIQAVIFFFSVRAFRGKKGDRRTRILVLGVYLAALILSVVFDYSFICNTAYDLKNEGVQGNDVYLSQEYHGLMSDARKYEADVEGELAGKLDPLLTKIEGIVGESAGGLQVPVFEGGDSNADNRRSALEGLIANGASPEELERFADGLADDADSFRRSADAARQNAGAARQDAYAAGTYGQAGAVGSAVAQMGSAVDLAVRYDELAGYYDLLASTARSAEVSSGLVTASSFNVLVAELRGTDIDPGVVSDSLSNIRVQVVSARDQQSGESLKESSETIGDLNDIADAYEGLSDMHQWLDRAEEHLQLMSRMAKEDAATAAGDDEKESEGAEGDSNGGDDGGETPDSAEGQTDASPDTVPGEPDASDGEEEGADEGSDGKEPAGDIADRGSSGGSWTAQSNQERFDESFDKNDWIREWTTALGLLRSALEAAPSNEYGSSLEPDEMIAKVNELEHDRLFYISDLEQAIQYGWPGEFLYQRLAWLCGLLALFLDLGSLGLGMFANAMRREAGVR